MASLAEKTSTLGYENALHLLRRATSRPSKSFANSLASLTPAQALDQLFTFVAPSMSIPVRKEDGTMYFPDFNNPGVTYDGSYDYTSPYELIHMMTYNAAKDNTIQSKLTMLLHSIFIVSYSSSSETHDYLQLLRYYANKSIKELAYKMSLNPLMLSYLSNNSNVKNSPNQNYAREFLELFTILKGPQVSDGNYTNYTEFDVQQAAKVLTGFRYVVPIADRMNYLDKGLTANTATHIPNPTNAGWTYGTTNIPTGYCQLNQHDTGNKTFSSSAFGGVTITGSSVATGSYTVYDELQAFINLIFAQPETAKNYARKIYRFFVKSEITAEVETDIITPMSAHLLSTQNGMTYNIESTVKLLLKSTHFYDEDDAIAQDEVIGAKVKSPFDLMVNVLAEGNVALAHSVTNSVHFFGYYNNLRYRTWISGFQLLSSVDVSGYPGYSSGPNYDKNWVTIATLNQRYINGWIETLLNGYNQVNFNTRLDSPEFIRSSGNFSTPSSPAVLLDEMFDIFFVNTPQGLRYGYFEFALLNGLSAANWATTWNAWIADLTSTPKKTAVRIAIDRLLKAIFRSTEYQVM